MKHLFPRLRAVTSNDVLNESESVRENTEYNISQNYLAWDSSFFPPVALKD